MLPKDENRLHQNHITTNPHPNTLCDLFELDHNADNIAFIHGNQEWRRGQLARLAMRIATGLQEAGVRAGDRVLLHLRNGPEIAGCYLACFQLGAICVPLNLRFKSIELDALVRRVRPTIYIGEPDLYRLITSIDADVLGPNARFVVGEAADGFAQSWTKLLTNGAPSRLAIPDASLPAVLLSTSGTTGQPKFVTHSLTSLTCGASQLIHAGPQKGDINAFFLPMVHGSGLFFLLASLLVEAPMIMLNAGDSDGILDAIECHRCTYMVGMPTMLAHIMARQRVQRRNVESLRICLAGGDVCLPGQQERFEELFGVPLRSFWAATEAPSTFTYGLRPGPVSRPVPGVEIRLVDSEGRSVSRGTPGQAFMRGPHVALGYWKGPGYWDAFPDGWFPTGDLMQEEEDGHFLFITRVKDVIVRGGSNISPVEVERILTAHPAVRDAGVVGTPDRLLGQKVVGFVQLADGQGDDQLQQILRDISSQIADYKLPEELQSVPEIPRNSLGKIDRARLLAML
ncbi:MAG TPA: class I adenylate-forming enzyme family protein [Acetobacteraceae bacterium]|nr:class I adenylate-forming enzyme family protein [Acetobacteraceae bacterium]